MIPGYPLTIDQCRAWRAQGMSWEAIGKRIGKDRKSVTRWAARNGLVPRLNMKPLPVSKIHKCQYIAGKPTSSDNCKCLAPAAVDKPYCEKHYRKCNFVGSAT